MTFPDLHYEMIRTRGLTFEVATCGAGPRLALLLHGFPESAHSWRHQIPLLERLGYRVWAPNLRGYGRSDKPRGRRAYVIRELEQDVTDLIDASGASSVLLIGHDWGGTLAWSYAAHGARPLSRLVVMNAPQPEVFARALRTNPAQLLRSWYMFLFQLPWLPERLMLAREGQGLVRAFREAAVHKEHFGPEDIAPFVRNAQIPGALTAMLNYYRALPWSLAQSKARGPKTIEVPTLFLWGEQDAALGKELTEGTAQFVSDLTLRFIPDASHWVQQDAPETVNHLLETWLTEQEGRARVESGPVPVRG